MHASSYLCALDAPFLPLREIPTMMPIYRFRPSTVDTLKVLHLLEAEIDFNSRCSKT